MVDVTVTFLYQKEIISHKIYTGRQGELHLNKNKMGCDVCVTYTFYKNVFTKLDCFHEGLYSRISIITLLSVVLV